MTGTAGAAGRVHDRSPVPAVVDADDPGVPE